MWKNIIKCFHKGNWVYAIKLTRHCYHENTPYVADKIKSSRYPLCPPPWIFFFLRLFRKFKNNIYQGRTQDTGRLYLWYFFWIFKKKCCWESLNYTCCLCFRNCNSTFKRHNGSPLNIWCSLWKCSPSGVNFCKSRKIKCLTKFEIPMPSQIWLHAVLRVQLVSFLVCDNNAKLLMSDHWI